MKTKNLIERLSLFLLALVLTMPAWAQGNEMIIASKADWGKFCDRVARGETTLNAKMTADVDLGEDIWQVGASRNYSGTFDGQGHTLTVNWNSAFSFLLAPFAYVENATIKNLRVKGHITGKRELAGLIYTVHGNTTLSNCVSEVDIKGESDLSGMIYRAENIAKVTFTDCVVKGALNSDATNNMAGFVYQMWGDCTFNNCLYLGTNNATEGCTFGWTHNITNCYYLNACGEAQGMQVTEEQLKNGAVAYKLQNGRSENVWGQKLGTDNEPQLTAEAAKHVYEVKFTLNNEVKATRYANGGGSVATLPTAKELLGEDYNRHHYYTVAFAGDFSASTTITEDRQVAVTLDHKEYYEIKNKDDWKAFCDLVNGGQNAIDAKMTKDVDLGTEIVQVGNSIEMYTGMFDGQGHTLSFDWTSGPAPFDFVDGATIKNLRVKGKITGSGQEAAGLVYQAYGATTISNCVSDVEITSSIDWDACEAAGLVQTVAYNGKVTVTDCVVKGNINATTEKGRKGMAGFVYTLDDGGACTLTNCLYLGKNNGVGDECFTFAPAGITLNNCHYLNACGTAQGTQVTKAQLESGYVAHKLQGMREETVWGQVLGTDIIPQLTAEAAKQVYEVKFTLNGKVKAMRYANRGGHVSLPTVQEFLGEAYNPANPYKLIFDGDFSASTPVNSDRTVAVVVAESYEIATKADWQAFCNRVNDGQTAINAKLMNDVDLSEEITMAGTIRNYNGTFDGQGHTLTLNWNSQSGEVAPFKFVNNATIKNLRVNGKIKSDGRTLSALVCNAVGNVTLSGCVSEVDITSNYHGVCELAGMIAYVNDRAEVAITDCVVKGAFNSMAADKKGMAGFVYLQTGYCTLTNCLYAGTNNATAGSYTFGSNTIRKNCYYLNPCGKAQGERIVEKQLESGEVAYKLQGDRTDSCHWAQVLGEWPGLYREADKAKPNYVYYNKDNNGWACDDFRLTDGQSLPIGLDFTATKATYDRTLAAGKATLCLPYELPVQGFRAYTLADRQESRTAVHFKEVNGTLGAYRPYLLVADGTLQLGGENLQVKADRSSIVLSAGNYYFKGAVHDVVNWWLTSDHAYILQADGQFHKVTSDNPSVTVPAYRAYISYNSHEGAKPLSIVFDGETTGIYGTTDDTADGAADGAVYNLQGQRVADRLDDSVRRQIPTGVYIVNGRKVIVK
ncbi:peptidase M26 [Prevotella denticola]|uniref:peptidase M26 n=1 Tax=Prevotella denticola TaxID=28129 RepID=UPI001C5D3DD1|nr:peptidase M26 [Prevotella denticola]MBW4899038.1 peptidase M26 [Prevotella denticola]